MGKNTKISWATDTFNGWIGCHEVSPACDNCYARTLSERWGKAKWGKDTERVRTSASNWHQPVKWNAQAAKDGVRRRVFSFSLADVFEDRRDLDPWRNDFFDLIETTPNLDWMLLTKRHDCIERLIRPAWLEKPRENVWLGVTTENQRRADERIPELLSVPAKVHWISAEPLLGAIDFRRWMPHEVETGQLSSAWVDGISWVIVGGESGAGARRMELQWARQILKHCQEYGVAYHMKQKGEVLARELGCKDRAGKDINEWPIDLRVQEFPCLQAH
jgi:protein gp37